MTSPLTDPLVRGFEECTLDPATFRHREHLYVAWAYLRALSLEDALARYVRHLQRFATAAGAPGKYHATITWVYMLLLHAALEQAPELPFDDLLAANPGLLDQKAVFAHYGADQLASAEARRRFCLPTPR